MKNAKGSLVRQQTVKGPVLLLVGPKGEGKHKGEWLRGVSQAEALQVWGLKIPKTSSAHLLRHSN